MKAKSSTPIMGLIEFGWSNKYLVPLEVAHQIQMLVAQHGTSLNDEYRDRSKRFAYFTKVSAPPVNVYNPEYPVFDCTGMNIDDVREWESAVTEGLKTDDQTTARDIVPPDVWLSMKGN